LSTRNERKRAAPPAIYLVAAVIAAIAGFGTVYVSFAPSDNGESAVSSADSANQRTGNSPLAGLNKGAMAPLVVRQKPVDLPPLTFTGADGKSVSLADFSGKIVLLNIWATWCVPCREEMASLDRLQRKLGVSALLVMPLSIDRQGIPVVKTFYDELGLQTLGIYVDQSGKAARDLDALGVPTTLLIDREGREIGRKIGAAEWDSPELVRLIQGQIKASASEGEAGQ